MRQLVLIAPLVAGLALATSLAHAQEPKLPATPSMDQKGSDDLSKPAGAAKPAPAPAAPKAPAKAAPKAEKSPSQHAAVPPKHQAAKAHAASKPRAKGGHVAPKRPARRKR